MRLQLKCEISKCDYITTTEISKKKFHKILSLDSMFIILKFQDNSGEQMYGQNKYQAFPSISFSELNLTVSSSF